jgi:TRAP-type C4-dicarboxylate transport system substrate-binding protein
MKRSRFGALALVFGVAGAFLAGRGVDAQPAPPPAAGTTRTLSVATLAPAGSAWMRVFEAWNREIRRRTNKSLSLTFYPGGVQGDESEVIRKIRQGRLDGAAVTAVGLAQIHRPALTFQMPGMFRGYSQLDAARNGLNTEMTQAFDQANFVLMGWADVGTTHPFSRTPVRTPAELRALHPWAWRDDAVLPAFYSVINANPVTLQVPEVLSALQTNRIDSFVSSPVATLALQWSSRVTHMTQVDCAISIGATVFGKNQFNALSAEHQTVLRETATQFHQQLIRNLRRDEGVALTTLQSRGITMVPVSEAERGQWTTAFQQTRTRLTGQIAPAAFIARVAGYNR